MQDIVSTHDDEVGKPAQVIELIHAYRVRGHLMADTNPLEFQMRKHPDLDIVNHNLTLWDLDREFATGGFGGVEVMKLRDILGVLRDSYCRTIGIEYMYISDPEQRRWIQDRIEFAHSKISREEQLYILNRLNVAEAFETFLQTKYVGQKRFSLEGGRDADPAARQPSRRGSQERPRRGRDWHGPPRPAERTGQHRRQELWPDLPRIRRQQDPKSAHGSGDVKYHLGADGHYTTADGASIDVSLASNPSHLEAVDPVLEGIVRAKQDLLNKGGAYPVLPGSHTRRCCVCRPRSGGRDAEPFAAARISHGRHRARRQQPGWFTTSPLAAVQASTRPTLPRMIQAPIFHVNGDDPEAAVRVARLALEYRQAFKKDVVIDLVCYRRRGHNEADDPSMTQPLMYNLIDSKRSIRKLYTEALIGRGDITLEEAEAALRDYRAHLEKAFTETRDSTSTPHEPTVVENAPAPAPEVETAISLDVLKKIADSQINLPPGFVAHPRLLPQLQRRAAMVDDDAIDWAMGELIAIGSLMLDGHPVRLAGQDTGAAHSPNATPSSSIARPARSTRRWRTSRQGRHRSTCTTRCSLSMRRWASSMATR